MTPTEEAHLNKATDLFCELAKDAGPHALIYMLSTLSDFAMFLGIVEPYKNMLTDILNKIDDVYKESQS